MVLIHILLTILKILGILVLVMLGMILLAVLCLLFVPVTYAAWGKKTESDLEGRVRVAWLFGGLSGTVCYRDKQTGVEIRVLGIPLFRLRRWLQARKKKKGSSEKKPQTAGRDSSAARVSTEKKKAEKTVPSEEPKQTIPSDKTEGQERTDKDQTADAGGKPGPDLPENGFSKTLQMIRNRILGLFQRILSIPRRLLERFRKIRLTISRICDRIKRWKDFLTLDTTKRAVKFLLGRGRALLHHILPRKVRGDITMGFDDPSVTGQVLAAAGVLYPLYKESIQITPVFDRKVLEGELKIRGRLLGWMFLWTAWKIYRNQDIRTTWKGFQNKEA